MKKNKNIALKASRFESDKENECEDEDFAMISRKFRRFFKKPSTRGRLKDSKNKKGKKEAIIYFECKKSSHIKSECPLLDKPK